MSRIHPTAIIEDGAKIGDDAEIGPYCHIGPNVVLGPGVRLHSHAVIAGHTEIGAGCTVYPFASLGHPPQHAKYAGENVQLIVGPRNLIREYVTFNCGTVQGGGVTRIGADNMFMAGSHVGHDGDVGNHVTFANNATLGGHVTVGDNVFIGGQTVVHQNQRVGSGAFLGGMSGVDGDVIPNGIARGMPSYLGGLNIIGMKRRGMARERIHRLRKVYRVLFRDEGAGSVAERVAQAAELFPGDPDVKALLDFLRAPAKRPLCTPPKHRHMHRTGADAGV